MPTAKQTAIKQRSIRLGTAFGLAADNLVVTPSIGDAAQVRKHAWPGPPFLAYQAINSKALHLGEGLYAGVQQITFSVPALAVS